MSLAEKDCVNRLLLSLPPRRGQVNPLPDLVVRVLQENGTRCCGGGEDDVHALGDETLCAIKNRVGAYLDGIARRGPALSERKEGVIGQNESAKDHSVEELPVQSCIQEIPCQAALKSFPSQATSESIPS
jgi:hypothetical protein